MILLKAASGTQYVAGSLEELGRLHTAIDKALQHNASYVGDIGVLVTPVRVSSVDSPVVRSLQREVDRVERD